MLQNADKYAHKTAQTLQRPAHFTSPKSQVKPKSAAGKLIERHLWHAPESESLFTAAALLLRNLIQQSTTVIL
jgi:hypothetical protein